MTRRIVLAILAGLILGFLLGFFILGPWIADRLMDTLIGHQI